MAAYADLPLTVTALDSAPDDGNRYEVIEGELSVSTAPGYPHQTALLDLASELNLYLDDHPIGKALLGFGVVFDEWNGVIPDLLFVGNARFSQIFANNRLTAAPEIMVEVLSLGIANEDRDRRKKMKLYSSRGVQEHWIIDPEERTIEVNRTSEEGGLAPAKLQLGDDLTSPLLPTFRVSLARIFRHRLPFSPPSA